VRLLEDPEPLNRGAASRALADIGPSAAEQAIPALARALAKDDAWPVRRRVASDLGRLAVNSPEAIAPLTAALDDPHDIVRKEAARALESLGRR
jgi:HEAT repeat protein